MLLFKFLIPLIFLMILNCRNLKSRSTNSFSYFLLYIIWFSIYFWPENFILKRKFFNLLWKLSFKKILKQIFKPTVMRNFNNRNKLFEQLKKFETTLFARQRYRFVTNFGFWWTYFIRSTLFAKQQNWCTYKTNVAGYWQCKKILTYVFKILS